MTIYDEVANYADASSAKIKKYREHMQAANWSQPQKLALATLLATHNIDEGDVEGFIGAYGNLPFNQITDHEQQPGQGVSKVNREILNLILEKHDDLEALEQQCEVWLEKHQD